jgi:hypothetical protein
MTQKRHILQFVSQIATVYVKLTDSLASNLEGTHEMYT